jgi:hypothetical protein
MAYWKPRKKKTKEDLFNDINKILLKSGMVKEPINFYGLNHTEVVIKVYEYCKILEFKFYYKKRMVCSIYLRKLYTFCEKLSRLEKKEILDFKI